MLEIGKFTINSKCRDDITLPPMTASTLRGAFGINLKSTVCAFNSRKKCDKCLLKNQCLYSTLFQTTNGIIDEDGDLEAHTPPRPFVINSPFYDRPTKFPNNSNLSWELILVGTENIKRIPYIITAIERMGNKGLGKDRGKFKIENIIQENSQDSTIIYKNNDKTVKNNTENIILNLPRQTSESYSRVKVNFLSPMRIKKDGKITDQITFKNLIKNILRRYSFLKKYYQPDSSYPDTDQVEKILSKAENGESEDSNLEWKKYSRYSNRKNMWMDFAGVQGEIIFKGEIAGFLPYLEIGSQINVGKSTCFGFGNYSYEKLE
ncbi:MAG: CRISPR system precrRNA processing endoribonuclease RAMP protein Cas6 [Candidatus Marinimicrobia bacterium]|nr:CRISPR system precrRNA processing endoribonuclease RAMP protein Cas6 [Candidatus Neomarinimicrobiota bacterium]